MIEFDYRACGIPCIVRVVNYESFRPARVHGPVEDCYASEGGMGDWELLDRNGRRAEWLECKLNDREREAIDDAIFERMECRRYD